MSGKVVRCDRCRKRWRDQPNWNEVYIAGLVIGYVCPKCQTAEEWSEAEVNYTFDPLPPLEVRGENSREFVEWLASSLARKYPTPEHRF